MNGISNKLESYINNVKRRNHHPELLDVYKSFYNYKPNNKYITSPHIIFYGPSKVGKYSQALFYMDKYSNSGFKYERKITLNINNKNPLIFKISDIHLEIDMELLGCNAKSHFNDIYNNAIDIFSTKPEKSGFILCKNFHKIHNELLDVFYSYMQNLEHKNVKINFILISEHLSFIPNNILKKCQIVNVSIPKKAIQTKNLKDNEKNRKRENKTNHINKIYDKYILDTIKNKDVSNNKLNKIIYKEPVVAKRLFDVIVNYETISFSDNRELLYDMLIYDIDLNECINILIGMLVINDKLTKENINIFFHQLYSFLKYYNNNYRPIYHLERFLYNICNIVHEL
tara:strand:- start:443 stop:1468 length:1026 start_codon:yes stop_codon:yes gene_type:complete